MATPKFKIYDEHGKYQAACREVPAAAILVEFYGPGATIRLGHSKADTVWTAGEDTDATESYDETADIIATRWRARNLATMKKNGYSDADIERISSYCA